MFKELSIQKFLDQSLANRASDLHIIPGCPPIIRVEGRLMPLDGMPPVESPACESMIRKILNDSQLRYLYEHKTLDSSLNIGERNYRINVHMVMGEYGIVVRLIPDIPQSPSDINLPVIINSFSGYESGLIIVTGRTGHGKSTTVACIVNLINETRSSRINIIEESLEFIHRNKRSYIVHQEVGRDCEGFQEALKSCMRQNPDVIVVGEIRDPETMAWTLSMAETGHLIITTMHSVGVEATIDRIINFFPPEHHSLAMHQLSVGLRAIISQILVPSRSGRRVPACEILINTKPVRNAIREGRLKELPNLMATSKAGMRTMKQSLDDLLQRRIVDHEAVDNIKEQFDIGEVR